MPDYALVPHPDFIDPAIRGVTVTADRWWNRALRLVYRVDADWDDLIWPEPEVGTFTHELWQHTCFEAFIAEPDSHGYIELNMAPSAHYAAYAFDGYRAEMRRALIDQTPVFGIMFSEPIIEAAVTLPMMRERTAWDIGLSAIIEAPDGAKSYWALSHRAGRPDFHDRDCFRASLPPPDYL